MNRFPKDRFRFPVIQDFEIGKRYEKEDCKEQEIYE
jgi:hypothetical protein